MSVNPLTCGSFISCFLPISVLATPHYLTVPVLFMHLHALRVHLQPNTGSHFLYVSSVYSNEEINREQRSFSLLIFPPNESVWYYYNTSERGWDQFLSSLYLAPVKLSMPNSKLFYICGFYFTDLSSFFFFFLCRLASCQSCRTCLPSMHSLC